MNDRLIKELEERLLRYVRIDTTADPDSTTSPSSRIQFDLLELLAGELKEIGAADVELTDYGTVLATIPATVDTAAPTIATIPARIAGGWAGRGCGGRRD